MLFKTYPTLSELDPWSKVLQVSKIQQVETKIV